MSCAQALRARATEGAWDDPDGPATRVDLVPWDVVQGVRQRVAALPLADSGERRLASAPALSREFLESHEVTFDELVERAGRDAELADVAAWLQHAVHAGLIEDAGARRLGERRFRLRRRGEQVLGQARRSGDGPR